jgi:transcriptional regulator of arginine metabolism
MTLDADILRLLARHEVVDQAHLLELLTREGHELTQPTLSRHLKKLSVQKRDGRYQRVEPGPAGLPAFQVVAAPPNLLVLRTLPGFAQALAYTLDQRQLPGLAGTVAGDDTIFMAVSDPALLNELMHTLERLTGA